MSFTLFSTIDPELQRRVLLWGGRFAVLFAVAFLLLPLVSCHVISSATPLSAPRTSIPPNTVEVWVTLVDRSKLLSREPSLTFQSGNPESGNAMIVHSERHYQQFEGGGAAMTDSSAWLIMNILDETTRQELMRNLFTRQGSGIGLNYLRVPMGASDFALADYTYDDLPAGQTDPKLEHFSIEQDKAYLIPALQLATRHNPELRLIGSPWSPPAWMKKDKTLHGSTLLPEYFPALASYHVRWIQAYLAEGLTVEAITPQNEPMYATENYPSMYMSAEDQQVFVRDYLAPALKKAGLETKILILDHNWDLAYYALQVLADARAAEVIDGVAFHCYAGTYLAQEQIHSSHPDKGIWLTECSGGDWSPSFRQNLVRYTRNLVVGNFRYWGNSLILWNLALDENDGPQNGGCPNCRGVVTIDRSKGTVTYNEEYYILGHVTKFVDRGAYRVESVKGSLAAPDNVAWLNPDGTLVLIVVSETGADFSVSWSGKSFSYRLPVGGVVTFHWNANLPAQTP